MYTAHATSVPSLESTVVRSVSTVHDPWLWGTHATSRQVVGSTGFVRPASILRPTPNSRRLMQNYSYPRSLMFTVASFRNSMACSSMSSYFYCSLCFLLNTYQGILYFLENHVYASGILATASVGTCNTQSTSVQSLLTAQNTHLLNAHQKGRGVMDGTSSVVRPPSILRSAYSRSSVQCHSYSQTPNIRQSAMADSSMSSLFYYVFIQKDSQNRIE